MKQLFIVLDVFCYGVPFKSYQDREAEVCFQLPATTILLPFFFLSNKTVLLLIGGKECKYLSESIVVNGLWKALLTSSTSIINEGKGKVFVTVSFYWGLPAGYSGQCPE